MGFTPYPNEIFTTFSFFGFFMCIIPLPWHLKAWNAGTCLYMFWAGVGCLILFINSIVWHGNAFNPAPIWCDICGKILVGTSIGIPASSLCINRRLYLLQLHPTRSLAVMKSEKLHVLAVDLGISLGLPFMIMILHYIPQGHRFNILEDIGCYPDTYNTWVAVMIINVPTALVGLVSTIYAIRAIISINKRRSEFKELLSSQLFVTSNQYFRLMCLAGTGALIIIPITGLVIYNVTTNRLFPWISWQDTHSNFYRSEQYPAVVWHNFPDASVIEFSRWMHIICAVLFFSFFGFAEEALYHYRLTIDFVLKVIGIRNGHQIEAFPLSQSGPTHRLTFATKRHQVDSFSTFPTVPISPDGGEQFSPSRNPLRAAPDDRLASQPAAFGDRPSVGQENERRPSLSSRITYNLRSFLDLGNNDRKHASFAHSQVDISTIEEGQSFNTKLHSSGLSRHFRSFLNFN